MLSREIGRASLLSPGKRTSEITADFTDLRNLRLGSGS
jgi:hypothetical protein